MFEKAILVTVASLLTIGCGTASPDANRIHAVQNLPVEPPKSVVPMVRVTPSAAAKVRPPATMSPVVVMEGQDRAKLLACIDLAKPDLVRPDTIEPNLSKTKITTNSKGVTTVKMPFSALNVNNQSRDDFMMATCKFTKAGKGSISVVDINN